MPCPMSQDSEAQDDLPQESEAPQAETPQEVQLEPTSRLLASVERFLMQRRLITTRVHVVGPEYVPVSLDIAVAAEPRQRRSPKVGQ